MENRLFSVYVIIDANVYYIIFIPNPWSVALKSGKNSYVTLTHPPIHQFASLPTLLMLNGIPIAPPRISIDFSACVYCAIPSTINLMDMHSWSL